MCFLLWISRDTLTHVLRGEWAKLPQVNKTHLNVTLKNTATNLANTPASKLCHHVSNLVTNPWADPTLSNIIHGNPVTESEGKFDQVFLLSY